MYYELYIDSLFLINFTMNLYVLFLTNRKLGRTATRRRLLLGAALGAAGYCVSFFIPFRFPLVKNLFLFSAVSILMVKITFRHKGLRAFLKICSTMLLYTFLFGGCLMFLFRRVPFLKENAFGIWGIMGIGGIIYILVSYLYEKNSRQKEALCDVCLKNNGHTLSVKALIDTGNSLVEPLSGKPVSILEKEIMEALLADGEPKGFRVVPYRSIGKENGILQAYEISEMIIERDGMKKICNNIYIGISEAAVSAGSNYRMIIHPKLMEG